MAGVLTISYSQKEILVAFPEVYKFAQSTIKELREVGNLFSLGFAFDVFGSYLVYNDRLDEGEKLLQEGLDILKDLDTDKSGDYADFARLAYKLKNFSQAESYIKQAYDESIKYNNEFLKATSLAIWGRIKLAQGNLQEAERLLLESLSLGHSETMPLALSHTLIFLGELSIAKGNIKQGVSWLHLLSQHHAIEKRDSDEVVKILENTKHLLSARDMAKLKKESKSLIFENVVSTILNKRLEFDHPEPLMVPHRNCPKV